MDGLALCCRLRRDVRLAGQQQPERGRRQRLWRPRWLRRLFLLLLHLMLGRGDGQAGHGGVRAAGRSAGCDSGELGREDRAAFVAYRRAAALISSWEPTRSRNAH